MDDMSAIYQQHARTVYKFLLAQCRDPDLAEELTQETFYQAVRSADGLEGGGKVSVWLCQIAKHLWYQHLRERNRESPRQRRRPWHRRGGWNCCGASTACPPTPGRWYISGPSAVSASGRSATCWGKPRPGRE